MFEKIEWRREAAGLVPGSGDWFNELCRKRTGLNNLIAETEIHETNITRFDKKELQKLLDSKKGEIRITY